MRIRDWSSDVCSSDLGAVLARNLFKGGFDGPILPVHPRHESLEGVLAYPTVAALPLAPALAIIATPPQAIPPLVAELGGRGTRAAVVISAAIGRASCRERVCQYV